MKMKFKNLLVFVIVLLCSFVFMNDAYAAVKVTSVSSYSGTNAHHRTITGGKNAWCMNKSAHGPTKGTKLSVEKTYTSGHYIYILNHGNPNSGSKKDVLTIQNALWMARHYNGASNSPSVPSSYAYYNEGKALWDAAKNAGGGYVYRPTVSITSGPGKLKYTDDGFYTSNVVGVRMSETANNNYTVTFSGSVPQNTGIYSTSGQKIGGSGTVLSVSNFVIKVPASSVTQNYSFNVGVIGPYTTYVNQGILYTTGKSGYQKLLSFTTTGTTPSASTSASIEPIHIRITKKDADTNTPLAGAKYRVFKNSDCTGDVEGFTDTYTTGTDGSVNIINLPVGSYYVKEIAAPPGYSIASNSCLPADTSGKEANFTNKKNSVLVQKKDLDGNLISDPNGADAEFGIYTNALCNKPATYDGTTTEIPHSLSKNGVVTFERMASINPDDKTNYYYIKEEMPPRGYQLANSESNCKRVRVNGTIEFRDAKIDTQYISVQKRDGFTNFGINEVRIGLYTDSTCTTVKQQAVATKNGYVTFPVDCAEDRTCSYYVKEMESPEYYVPKKGKGNAECIEIKTGQGTTDKDRSAVIYNMPYGTIRLLKLESEKDKPLSDVEFALLNKDKEPAKDIEGKVVANQKTDENGILEFKDVVYGTYYLKEISNGGKHKIPKDLIKFELNSSTDSIKLAKRGSEVYYLGDANGDKYVNDEDISAYQQYITNFNSFDGLNSTTKLALAINGKSITTVADLKTNMNILKLYQNYVNGSGDAVHSAATKYNKLVTDFCSTVGEDNCKIENLESIVSMYVHNNEVKTAYNADMATLPSKQSQYDTALARYNQAKADFERYCGNATTDESTANPSDTPDGDSTNDPIPYDCTKGYNIDGVPVEYPGDVRPSEATVRAAHPLQGDFNGDYVINQTDLDILTEAITNQSHDTIYDLTGDNPTVIDSKDVDVLNRYIIFSGGNMPTIIALINNILDNKNILCNNSTDSTCSIDNKDLSYALSVVGKRYNVPDNIAKSSIFLKNEPITMKISKYQISKSKEINGAKIVIRDSKNNKFLEYTSGNKPKEFKIPAGKYTLTEKVSPKGYKQLTTTISFTVNTDGSVKLTGAKSNLYTIKKGTDNHLIIYNELGRCEKYNGKYYGKNGTVVSKAQYEKECANVVPIPDTGSNIAVLSVITGIVLVVGGGYVIYKKLI